MRDACSSFSQATSPSSGHFMQPAHTARVLGDTTAPRAWKVRPPTATRGGEEAAGDVEEEEEMQDRVAAQSRA